VVIPAQRNRKRLKARQRGRKAERITSMALQPARQRIRSPGNLPIEPHTGRARKVNRLCSVFIAVGHCRRDETEINGAAIPRPRHPPPPGTQRVANFADPQCTGKVISTTGRHHQDWRLQTHQRPEVTMNRPIPAKHEDCLHLLLLPRQPNHPLDRRVLLECPQISRRGSQSENRSSPHFAGSSLAENADPRNRAHAF